MEGPLLRRGGVGRWGKGMVKDKKKREIKLLKKKTRQSKKERRGKRQKGRKTFYFENGDVDEEDEVDKYLDLPRLAVEAFITKTAPKKQIQNGQALFSLLSSRSLPKSSPLHHPFRYTRNTALAGKMAKQLINNIDKVDVCEPGTGCTPLHYAVMSGARGVVKRLLKRGADPNARNKFGQTPCHLAHRTSDISQLLKHGANLSLHDHHHNSPFSSLLSRGFRPEVLPLFYSDTLNVNERSKNDGSTLLHNFLRGLLVAMRGGWGWQGDLRARASMGIYLREFLETFEEADPSIEDENGVTPLCIALHAFHHLEMHWDCVFLLIKQVKKVYPRGYEENSHRWSLLKGVNGTNPLHSLVLTGFQDGVLGEELEEEMRRLIGDGVAIDQQDVHGNTPLHVAAEERRTNSIEILLKLGANVHVRNRDGETPLFVGVEAASSNAFYWHPNDLEALIAAGSDLRGVMIKTRFWCWDLVKFFLAHGVTNISIEEDQSFWDALLGCTSMWRWGVTLQRWKDHWYKKAQLLNELIEMGIWKEEREKRGFVEVLTERFVDSIIGMREIGISGGATRQGGLLEMGERRERWVGEKEGGWEEGWEEEDERTGEELYFGMLDGLIGGGGEVVFSDVGHVELEREVLGIWGEVKGEIVFCDRVLERILDGIGKRCEVWVKGGV